jgi:hypothetical protein
VGEYYPDGLKDDGRLASQSHGSSHKGGRRVRIVSRAITTVLSFVCYLAVLYGIKLMDLSRLITALFVLIDMVFMMLIIIYAIGEKEAEGGK